MSFTSLIFVVFFAAAAGGFYALPQKAKKPWLLACCYAFYMFARPAFALLLAGGTLVGFLCGLACERSLLGKRRLWIGLGVGYTLGVLFLFKYLDFFCASLLPVLGMDYKGFSLALPVGISFFSFALCGYLFDVQKGKLKAEGNLLDFALFVAFFPTLLAGPIGQARTFLPQLKKPVVFQPERLRRGFLRFLWGAFKKLVAADTLGLIVDKAFAGPEGYSGGALLLAVICYSLQIYFDFSAYSHMAVGCADVLGFSVTENFRAPYLSTSVKDFWKKWHISLTSWFREYLYFPLGGSRKGFYRTQLNVIIVFAVSGLWHGANWTFVLWGLLNGLYQAAGAMTDRLRGRLWARLGVPEDSRGRRLWQMVFTFGLLTVSWIFFRATSLDQAVFIIKRILLILRDGFGWTSVRALFSLRQVGLALLCMIPCFREDLVIARNQSGPPFADKPFVYWGVGLALVLMIAVFGVYGAGFDPKDFLYFSV